MPCCNLADSRSRPPGTPMAGWRQGRKRQRKTLHPNWLQRLDLPAKALFSWRDGGQGAWPRHWRAGLAWPGAELILWELTSD